MSAKNSLWQCTVKRLVPMLTNYKASGPYIADMMPPFMTRPFIRDRRDPFKCNVKEQLLLCVADSFFFNNEITVDIT